MLDSCDDCKSICRDGCRMRCRETTSIYFLVFCIAFCSINNCFSSNAQANASWKSSKRLIHKQSIQSSSQWYPNFQSIQSSCPKVSSKASQFGTVVCFIIFGDTDSCGDNFSGTLCTRCDWTLRCGLYLVSWYSLRHMGEYQKSVKDSEVFGDVPDAKWVCWNRLD